MPATTLPLLLFVLAAATFQASAFQTTQSNAATAKQFLPNQLNVTHYPYSVHLPDRTTRNLAPLTTPPPVVLSLSGSGARGPPDMLGELSGYDGLSRKIQEYNSGNYTPAHQLAAEEFLTIVPLAPIEGPQWNASWDVTVMPGILAQVASTYELDLTRVYLSTYSMGARAGWDLLIQNPNIFAAAVLSSGNTTADAQQLSTIFGIPIRSYYGTDDEAGLAQMLEGTNATYVWNTLLAAESAGTGPQNASKFLETIIVQNASHLEQTDRPWDEDVIVDGFQGAIPWMLAQSLPTGAQIPGINLTTYGGGVEIISSASNTTSTASSTNSTTQPP
ncbi:MAG: hypothetical protein CYPHOPRED_002750 [Cyphobasidiales sp. Tagirdzhanova-0007]|nr:MAG: hypothetical protein CYPHOPRED_002750 [Cyphobasidiales sp. Tagirdzhanova-0007]